MKFYWRGHLNIQGLTILAYIYVAQSPLQFLVEVSGASVDFQTLDVLINGRFGKEGSVHARLGPQVDLTFIGKVFRVLSVAFPT